MRPNLTKEISIKDFDNYYWLKEELQTFCRENGISASGSKIEIFARIKTYLLTGEIKKPIRKTKINKKIENKSELSLETVITENHRCSQEVRAFFKTIIPKFHFSTYIQNYINNNIGKTYSDVVVAWNVEEERKKDPTYKKNIAPQFEYNQFISDFFADPQNKEKTRKEAIEAWNRIKRLPGSNKYKP
ncbi:DUF6434 domain-containing protein [Alkalihalophilus lindianensis]|uniref:DUF6434 domain-containing protein n=1 Tax=Alkalihalophilus lindianensis TaxID=1630542 RepID=A0ABU3XEX3_9BACI|nr:DUF6434 domain-containing protein [Alkalihalophilus lindianensis]MDV2686431.1 DUF6434 domain-containing protein [Alkalihalophilus lindianensis]